jgi:hypothetical protein
MGEAMVGTTMETRPAVSLVIPCRPEYVSLCRLVVGALGASQALDDETVADLKVIVTEAVNCFLGVTPLSAGPVEESAGEADSLRLDFTVTPQEWTMVISNPEHTRRISQSTLPDPASEGALGLVIIEALVDSIERLDGDEGGSLLRLVKRLGVPGATTE